MRKRKKMKMPTLGDMASARGILLAASQDKKIKKREMEDYAVRINAKGRQRRADFNLRKFLQGV